MWMGVAVRKKDSDTENRLVDTEEQGESATNCENSTETYEVSYGKQRVRRQLPCNPESPV